MNPRQLAAYRDLLNQALVQVTDADRAAGAILLNSYNDELPNTEFKICRFRHFDSINRADMLTYLDWLSSAPGLYPQSDNMDDLKRVWTERGWFKRRGRKSVLRASITTIFGDV